MTDSRMRLLTTEVTVAMVVRSIWLKPSMMAPTKTQRPRRMASMDGVKMLMRDQVAVMMMPQSVAIVVASRMGMNTSVGCAAP